MPDLCADATPEDHPGALFQLFLFSYVTQPISAHEGRPQACRVGEEVVDPVPFLFQQTLEKKGSKGRLSLSLQERFRQASGHGPAQDRALGTSGVELLRGNAQHELDQPAVPQGVAQLDAGSAGVEGLDGETVAALIVFIERGVAYTWKTAYDESLSPYSPGALLMIEATKAHLDDLNIALTDSCAAPDHPQMDRLWSERRRIGTLIVGLTPGADRAARQTAAQLHLYTESRNLARLVRKRMRGFIRRR